MFSRVFTLFIIMTTAFVIMTAAMPSHAGKLVVRVDPTPPPWWYCIFVAPANGDRSV